MARALEQHAEDEGLQEDVFGCVSNSPKLSAQHKNPHLLTSRLGVCLGHPMGGAASPL